MKNFRVIVKRIENPCYCCSSIGGQPTKQNDCKVCRGTGIYVENHYYHIYKTKDGKEYCLDGDTLK